jgi:hypothetical protein
MRPRYRWRLGCGELGFGNAEGRWVVRAVGNAQLIGCDLVPGRQLNVFVCCERICEAGDSVLDEVMSVERAWMAETIGGGGEAE